MFTGLIAEIGTIGNVVRRPKGLEYEVYCASIADRLEIGASIAVNGVCQTVSMPTKSGFRTIAVESTLVKTTISSLRSGERVNLEPALRAGDPLDGHIMQGHAQLKSKLVSVKKSGLARVLEIEMSDAAKLGIIAEGSVGIDGISLTVSSIGMRSFTVHIIPETWDSTILKWRRAGDFLNIEGDLLARSQTGTAADLSENKLTEWGY